MQLYLYNLKIFFNRNIFLSKCLLVKMGGFQLAGTGKNKKVIENSPPPTSILARKGQRVKTFKNHIFCQTWSILILIFVLSGYNIKELFKNSV